MSSPGERVGLREHGPYPPTAVVRAVGEGSAGRLDACAQGGQAAAAVAGALPSGAEGGGGSGSGVVGDLDFEGGHQGVGGEVAAGGWGEGHLDAG
ncbi:hypothetical protein NCG97_21925 [Streptomyces lydicamycinicus]|nr:hypothetical protein [Streptomyces lydicamycinicus]USA02724.1 hypothetical protein NCG97_21925 [Streptomyces lydicamycinicus]